MIELSVNSDGSERVPYHSAAFPLHLSCCSLSMYPGMRCVSHWHDDYEFSVVRSGRMIYRVNGRPVAVAAGEGLYIAPRSVHSTEAVDGGDCEYLCVVFPTALLSASEHIAELLRVHLAAHEAARCLRLLPAAAQHREIIEGLLHLERITKQNAPDAQLRCLSVLYKLLADLGGAVCSEQTLPETDRNLLQIKDMIGYIQLHADRKLTLRDIARAGKLSRSSCENAFRRILHTSPIQYLIDCRLEKSMELLVSTSLSMTEIAQRCGFCSGSYFAERFRRRAGCTPEEFRRKQELDAARPGICDKMEKA